MIASIVDDLCIFYFYLLCCGHHALCTSRTLTRRGSQDCLGPFMVPRRKYPGTMEYPTLLVGRVCRVERRHRRDGAAGGVVVGVVSGDGDLGVGFGIGSSAEDDPKIKDGAGEKCDLYITFLYLNKFML